MEFFHNDRGEFWVPTGEAGQDEAGQWLADLIEFGVYATGVATPLVSSCEEGHTCRTGGCGAHPLCPATP